MSLKKNPCCLFILFITSYTGIVRSCQAVLFLLFNLTIEGEGEKATKLPHVAFDDVLNY